MNAAPLLALIRKIEARNDYNIVWGGIRAQDRPRKLTTMTIQQVLDWQRGIRNLGYASTACGAYQFIRGTLREFYPKAGLRLADKMAPANQDKIAMVLLERRGLSKYMSGAMGEKAFGNRLAMEWASLPVQTGLNRGQSYYAGDGLNHALTKPETVLKAIRQLHDKPPRVYPWIVRWVLWIGRAIKHWREA